VTIQLLQLANAEFVIGTAGSIASDEMRKHCKSIKGAIWVVDRANREVDFTERDRNVNAWHELVEKHPNTPSELSEDSTAQSPPGITSIWLGENPKHGELVTFTQSVSYGKKTSRYTHLLKIFHFRILYPQSAHNYPPSPTPNEYQTGTSSSLPTPSPSSPSSSKPSQHSTATPPSRSTPSVATTSSSLSPHPTL